MYVTSDTELIAKFRQIDGCAVVSEQQIRDLLKLLRAARDLCARYDGATDREYVFVDDLQDALEACKDIPCE